MLWPPAGKGILQLAFPSGWAGERVLLRVDRCDGDRVADWLRLSPRVMADGSLQIVGIEPGSYELVAIGADGTAVSGCAAVAAATAVRVAMTSPAAPR